MVLVGVLVKAEHEFPASAAASGVENNMQHPESLWATHCASPSHHTVCVVHIMRSSFIAKTRREIVAKESRLGREVGLGTCSLCGKQLSR